MRIGYKLNDRFDLTIFFSVLVLIGMGLLAIYSSTLNNPSVSNNFEKQLFFSFVSVFVFFVIYFIPYHFLRLVALPSYLFSVFLLIVVLFAGKNIKGAESWLSFGILRFQPSELAKIGVILYLSYWLSNMKGDINDFKNLMIALAIGFTPILLILAQPDMGTAIVFGAITLALIFWRGISLFSLFVVLTPGLVIFASMFGTYVFIGMMVLVLVALILFKRDLFISASLFVMNLSAGFFFDFVFTLLKPHQQKRILTFLNPDSDPLGSGYNAMQAKVAIGSGGFLGKGILEGNQTQLRFIPEQWTDFIYCVIGEELGFIGAVLIIILFLVLLFRLLNITTLAKDHFSSLIIIGIITLLFVHFAINIGMNLGITPVVGIPLPFLSYGGSSLLINMSLIGIALNIYKNRKIKA